VTALSSLDFPANDFPATVSTLASGLTVVHQHVPATPVVTVDVWVNAGAIAEPEPWSGMAHFLEHMIFKGTDRLLPGQFDQVIETRGGMTNAATSHDYAHFFINVAAAHLTDALPHFADLLLNAAIPDDEFDRERLVVLEELRQAYDDPDWVGFQSLMESVYSGHPYGRSVLGTETTLMGRSPQEMRQFHRAHYQADGMTVVVVGDVDQENTLRLVEQSFAEFAPRGAIAPNGTANPPQQTTPSRDVIQLPRIEQARLLMAWVGPGVSQLRDAYGLDLLSIALAGGRMSRLVWELREQRQLVHGIDSSFSLQRDASLFTISALLDAEYVAAVEGLIGDRLLDLAHTSIDPYELNRYKRQLCNDYAFSTETTNQLAGLYGYYSIISDPAVSVTYPAQIQSFQPEELQQLAARYLSPDRCTAVILQPIA